MKKPKDKFDTQHSIGQLLPAPQGRDAIHIAVVDVVAGGMMFPGQDVWLSEEDGSAWPGSAAPSERDLKPTLVGLVDPFLKSRVNPGDRFWLFLYPNTITGLRHQWTHPAFPEPVVESAQAEFDRRASVKWLTDFAHRTGYEYDEFVQALERHNVSFGSEGDAEDATQEREAIAKHLSAVRGKAVTIQEYFGCAC